MTNEYVGKDSVGKTPSHGSNTYFCTDSAMGTAGCPDGHINFLGEIRTGNVNNPNGIMSIEYALSDESYLPNSTKKRIKDIIKRMQGGT